MTTDASDADAETGRPEPAAQHQLRRPPGRPQRVGLVLVIAALAIAVRVVAFPHESVDYRFFLLPWYEYLDQHGGFAALRDEFANYNMPYLYLLAALTYLPVPPLVGIKLISVAFDLLLVFFAYRIVGVRYPRTWLPHLAAAAVALSPTVVVNGAMWGQVDSAYAGLGLGGVYFLLRHRPWWACVFFGLALACKLQIIFLFPVLLLLALTGRLPWRTLVAIPAVFLALDVPALLIGADPGRLFAVYAEQTGTYSALTLGAPSAYQFVPAGYGTDTLHTMAVLFTGAAVLVLVLVVVASRMVFTPARLVLVAAIFAVGVPYFLPSMHERYFYLADVLTVLVACYLPRLWYVPVLVQFASFSSYVAYLFVPPPALNTVPQWAEQRVDPRLLAALMLLALLALVRHLFRTPGLRAVLATRSAR